MKTILSYSIIEQALKKTNSVTAAARLLNVSYNTIKKHTKALVDSNNISLFDKYKNKTGKGIPHNKKTYKLKIEQVLTNQIKDYPLWLLKKQLIRLGMFKEECELCGFDEKRFTDGEIPLLLCQKDGDKNNYQIDNLELLCYNCYFLTVGNIFGKGITRKNATIAQLEHKLDSAIEDIDFDPRRDINWETIDDE